MRPWRQDLFDMMCNYEDRPDTMHVLWASHTYSNITDNYFDKSILQVKHFLSIKR